MPADEASNEIFRTLLQEGVKNDSKKPTKKVHTPVNYDDVAYQPSGALENLQAQLDSTPATSQFTRKTPMNERVRPESSSTRSDQISQIAEGLVQSIQSGNQIRSATFTYEWIEGIVDPSGQLLPEVRERLEDLRKDQLIDYLGTILTSIYV